MMRPAYMTAMRSQFSETTAMSCVISSIALPDCAWISADTFQDLVLDDDVETGRRFVGDDQLGIERKRHRDHGALTHAAAELMCVVFQTLRREPDHGEQRGNPFAARGGRHLRMSGDRLVELLLDGVDGIEPVHRVLRDERDIAPADAAQLGSAKTDELAAGETAASPRRGRPAAGCREWPWRSSTCRSRIRRRGRDSRPSSRANETPSTATASP